MKSVFSFTLLAVASLAFIPKAQAYRNTPLAVTQAVVTSAHANDLAYRNTPLAVTQAVVTSAHANDLAAFQSRLGRSAQCNWGDAAGMALIRQAVNGDARQLEITINRESAGHLTRARYVGYWSYYSETHSLSLVDKRSGVLLAEGEIECHFGMEGTKRERDLNRPIEEYPVKNCKLALLVARSFDNPAPRSECSLFRQTLED